MNERLPFLREKTAKLTLSPGVYFMKDKAGVIIYIGKAKNLKNRVTSYFRETPDHTPKVAKMVSNVYDYDFIVTDTEYEALVLECSLIKQHKPKYNILLKDDKGYHYIRISKEPFPRITAEKQTNATDQFIGPYTSSFVATQTVEEVNKTFRLPTCYRKFPQDFKKERPCLNYHINKCMGLCRGNISQEKYNQIIQQAIDYIRNGGESSIKRLTAEMEKSSENLDFEYAIELRDRINAIQRASQQQKIFDPELKSLDVIGVSQDYKRMCVAVLVYRNGKLFDKSTYFIGEEDKTENVIEDFISQYYMSQADIPKTILVEKNLGDVSALERLLKEKSGHAIHIVHRQKGNFAKLILFAKNNASEYLSILLGRTAKEVTALNDLSKMLGLSKPPHYIEAYDISNLASTAMVGGMTVFENGRPLKKAYRKFSIKDVYVQNDVACMAEVLERRFMAYRKGVDEAFSRLPDLILLDGSIGQLNAVIPVLKKLDIDVPIFGMVKDNKHRTRAITSVGGEIEISSSKQAFALITNIQDETHRFAISFQRSKHKQITYEMELTKVKGIGVKKAQKLIMHFKTKEAIKNADIETLSKVAGINIDMTKDLYEFIRNL